MRFRFFASMVSAGLAGGLGVASAHAALAPQYDRVKQFEAVLASGVVDVLGDRPIDRIVRGKNGQFEVWSGECVVFVKLKAVPPADGMVGPTTYEIAKMSPIACQ
jgi:hypothetical protein